jgi:hypothetical protein
MNIERTGRMWALRIAACLVVAGAISLWEWWG